MIQWTVKHATTVMLTVFAIAIFGSSSYCSLPREASPDITIPVVMITTAYPGASPADIEGLVTNPMENELAGLRNVKEMTSVSSEDSASSASSLKPMSSSKMPCNAPEIASIEHDVTFPMTWNNLTFERFPSAIFPSCWLPSQDKPTKRFSKTSLKR